MTKGVLIIKIIKGIIFTFTLLIVLILSSFIITRLVNKDNYSKVFGYCFFEVTSDSMAPKFENGDLILVKERNSDDYCVGMIVTYKPIIGNKPITHEIVERHEDIIITRGINSETNDADDEPFNVENIIGEVVGVYENYGKLETFIYNPIGLAIIIVGGLLIFEIINYFEKKLKYDNK